TIALGALSAVMSTATEEYSMLPARASPSLSSFAAVRPVATTLTPFAPSARTMPSPMPPAPPVTIATLPFIRISPLPGPAARSSPLIARSLGDVVGRDIAEGHGRSDRRAGARIDVAERRARLVPRRVEPGD